jgi:glycosyltransferase 2 family protein
VLVLFKLAVSVALLGILFSRIDVGQLWTVLQTASPLWLAAALTVYASTVIASIWRWRLLLDAQGVHVPVVRLVRSYLVSLYFNNFLPSNIGGDVIRIRDTAPAAGSKTLATAVVLVDRGLGLMGLVLVAACGASLAAASTAGAALPIVPAWLWGGFLVGAGLSAPAVLAPAGFGRMLQPLRIIHPEWIDRQIEKITTLLSRFRSNPAILLACFGGAVFVQFAFVAFNLMVAYALRIPIGASHLAVIVPLSFVLQMVPVSINGFGVREAAFSLYFSRIGLPLESALLLSLVPTALMMLFSLTGAAIYVGHRE